MSVAFFVLSLIIAVAFFVFMALLIKTPLAIADFWLKVITGLLLTFTTFSGIVTLVVRHFTSEAQAKQTAEARAAQAEAERKLDELRKHQRQLDSIRSISDNLQEALKDKAKGQAVVVYVGGSSDVIWVAEGLVRALNKAGWEVPAASQISSVRDLMPKTLATGDILVACPGRSGVPTHIGSLMYALSKEPYPFKVSAVASSSHEFPDDRPRIIVNPRF